MSKEHGYLMASANGGPGGIRPRKPSGSVQPHTPPPSASNPDPLPPNPMPVVLTLGTIIKFALSVVIPLIAAISLAALHYHKTNLHMEDPTRHLTRGERWKLETKAEAAKARDKLGESIKDELKSQTAKLEYSLGQSQKKRIEELGDELNQSQRRKFDRILREVRQARRDIQKQ